ncbi:hypothetical protein THAOC_35882 [Thalassiosira oceanica]|uniref:Uncharacterized protein n=1 Tax=Thalassiosira oceanica TaxID=159749 RepID=K0RFY7_THAOC|nr:hypothetical protein THAOC_35882 [Thalassiosira oceanica]|eukprot:EJK45502.1 hypothetical protein THAOC_35882 [Thalassiosira oceanica]
MTLPHVYRRPTRATAAATCNHGKLRGGRMGGIFAHLRHVSLLGWARRADARPALSDAPIRGLRSHILHIGLQGHRRGILAGWPCALRGGLQRRQEDRQAAAPCEVRRRFGEKRVWYAVQPRVLRLDDGHFRVTLYHEEPTLVSRQSALSWTTARHHKEWGPSEPRVYHSSNIHTFPHDGRDRSLDRDRCRVFLLSCAFEIPHIGASLRRNNTGSCSWNIMVQNVRDQYRSEVDRLAGLGDGRV